MLKPFEEGYTPDASDAEKGMIARRRTEMETPTTKSGARYRRYAVA